MDEREMQVSLKGEREMLEAMRAEAAQRNADLRKQAGDRLKANAEWNRKNKKAKE